VSKDKDIDGGDARDLGMGTPIQRRDFLQGAAIALMVTGCKGEMTAEQADQFYRSAWTLGTTLQVTEDQWPPTRAEFDTYWVDACGRVSIDDDVRAYLQELLNLRMIKPVLAWAFRPLLKFLTVGFLAPVFREALGVQWSDFRQRQFERLFLLVALVNRFLPVFIRQGGSYVLLADVRRRVRDHRALV